MSRFEQSAVELPGGIGNNEHHLKKRTDPDNRHLRPVIDSEHGYTQRAERRRGHVPHKVNERLETTAPDASIVSEGQDEGLGVPNNLPVIRFMPDGYFDPSSVSKIVLRQGAEAALELVPTANRLGYEILPAN